MSNDIPAVSVIIPVYNAAEFLKDGLNSLLKQTLREIEIICVDDGSTDGSLVILKEFEKADARIRVIHQENQGAGAARNNGMDVARGKYLAFLDADDFFEKNMLKVAYDRAEETEAEVCVFNADLYDHTEKVYKKCTWAFRKQYFPEKEPFAATDENVRNNIFRMFNGWPWDKLYQREYVRRLGIKYQNLRTTNDMLFVFIALACASRISTVDEVLIHQRVNVRTSLSRTREKSWDCFYIALLAMQKELKDRGLYDTLERAFVNWALNFSLWQLNTMTGSAYEKTYRLLKRKGFDRLDISRHNVRYFYSNKEYDKFLKIYTTPYEKSSGYQKAK